MYMLYLIIHIYIFYKYISWYIYLFIQELALLPQLENKSFMNAQIACMLDEGPCDPIGKKAKSMSKK